MVQLIGWAADIAGCGYWRISLPFQQLREQFGLPAVAVGNFAGHTPDDPEAVVVGQRIVHPWDTAAWKDLKAKGHPLVFELDDDAWSVQPANPSAPFWNPQRQATLAANIAIADLVTVSTEPLAQAVRKFNDNVVVLPNSIDAGLLEHERTRPDRLTVGWAGSISHVHDIEAMLPLFERLYETQPDVELHMIGTDFSPWLDRPVRHTPWSPDVATFQRTIDFDIGLAPIAKTRFNLSKSPIKAMEYGALGIPVIASAFGPYLDYVKHGETGFLASTPEDWTKYLRILVNDADARAELGAAGRRQAAEHTIQGNAYQWVLAYGELV